MPLVCPQCNAMYKDGFTLCSDCRVELRAVPATYRPRKYNYRSNPFLREAAEQREEVAARVEKKAVVTVKALPAALAVGVINSLVAIYAPARLSVPVIIVSIAVVLLLRFYDWFSIGILALLDELTGGRVSAWRTRKPSRKSQKHQRR